MRKKLASRSKAVSKRRFMSKMFGSRNKPILRLILRTPDPARSTTP